MNKLSKKQIEKLINQNLFDDEVKDINVKFFASRGSEKTAINVDFRKLGLSTFKKMTELNNYLYERNISFPELKKEVRQKVKTLNEIDRLIRQNKKDQKSLKTIKENNPKFKKIVNDIGEANVEISLKRKYLFDETTFEEMKRDVDRNRQTKRNLPTSLAFIDAILNNSPKKAKNIVDTRSVIAGIVNTGEQNKYLRMFEDINISIQNNNGDFQIVPLKNILKDGLSAVEKFRLIKTILIKNGKYSKGGGSSDEMDVIERVLNANLQGIPNIENYLSEEGKKNIKMF